MTKCLIKSISKHDLLAFVIQSLTNLGSMTDSDKVMNPQHVGRDPETSRFESRLFRQSGLESGITVWNSLLHRITDDLNVSAPVFKSRLKTFLCRKSYQ